MCWNACPDSLLVPTLTADKAIDRQVGQRVVLHSARAATAPPPPPTEKDLDLISHEGCDINPNMKRKEKKKRQRLKSQYERSSHSFFCVVSIRMH